MDPKPIPLLVPINGYKDVCLIGSGTYGVAVLIRDNDYKMFVRKMYRENGFASMIREVSFLNAFKNHPNVVTNIGCVFDVDNFNVILEYMHHDLMWFVSNHTRETRVKNVSKILRDILYALSTMHSENVSHRDIKAENILFSEYREGFTFKV